MLKEDFIKIYTKFHKFNKIIIEEGFKDLKLIFNQDMINSNFNLKDKDIITIFSQKILCMKKFT